MSTSNHAHALSARTDEQTLDEFDDLVVKASHGDGHAIGAIAIALGPRLLVEAKLVLGPFEQEAGDVLQSFLLSLVEGRSRFTPERGRGLPWMLGVVRAIARRHRADRDDDWGGGWSREE